MRNAAFWAKVLPVITAFTAGKPCQRKSINSNKWRDLDPLEPVAWYEEHEYRIKPAAIKYRRYLYKLSGTICLGSLTHNPLCTCTVPEVTEKQHWFVKWIDTEWQEHELPVDTEVGG